MEHFADVSGLDDDADASPLFAFDHVLVESGDCQQGRDGSFADPGLAVGEDHQRHPLVGQGLGLTADPLHRFR